MPGCPNCKTCKDDYVCTTFPDKKDCPYRKIKAAEQQQVSTSNLSALLNAIADDLQRKITEAKAKYDAGDWPQKFLYAHEGIGLMKAIVVIKRHRESAGI